MTSDPNKIEDQVLLADASDKKLRRALSLQDLFMISFGGVVGSGWLFGVSGAAVIAGPAAVISWVIAGIFMVAIALCFAEVASSVHKSGQLVRFPLYSHGGYAGFIIGWAYILGAITVPAIEAEAVISYAGTYIPWALQPNGLLTNSGIVVTALLIVGFFLLNYVGIKFLGRFNTIVTWWKLIIPTLTIIFLLSIFHASNFTAGGFLPFGWPGVFVCIPAGGIAFSYLGFRGAAQFAGEAKNPQRDVPRAIILSIVAAMILYVLLQVVFTGGINWLAAGVTKGNWSGLSTGPLHNAPFYNEMKEAGIALLAGFSSFLLADAIISPSGTGWIFLGEATRAVYGFGADGFFPKQLLKIEERTRIPIVALIVTTIIGAIFIAPFPSWYLFAGFITDAFTLSFIAGPLALHVFRKHAPLLTRPFKLPFALPVGCLAFVGAALIVYWSEFSGLIYVFSVVFAGLPVFYMLYAPKKLGISTSVSLVVGIVQFVLVVIDSFWGYGVLHIGQVVTGTQPTVPDGTLTQNFLIYWAALALIVWVPTLMIDHFANKDGKQILRSAWFILVLLFIEMIVSWFSVLGTFPYGPLAKAYIPFPYDTLAMVVVAVVIYFWGLRSGFRTPELAEVEQLEQQDAAAAAKPT